MTKTINARRARRMARQPDSTVTPVRDPASPIVQPPTDQAIAMVRQSKTAMVVQLLQRSDGASLDELVRATGWLAHTRKSTEEGLEQEFNSLDAQFDACAAYIASQRHEGWTQVRDRYDDGGFMPAPSRDGDGPGRERKDFRVNPAVLGRG